MNNQSKNINVSDELLYEFVMDEMEQESELIKGLWAKALAHSEGNDSKAKSLYMQYRVQTIKDQLVTLQIDLGDLSKEELFESIKNGFTVIPEKIQMIKEQKAVAEEKAIEVAIEEEVKKENDKYGKFGGWLIVFAIFLVIGNLYSFLMVERFFENDNLDALKLLYQNGMDDKASLLNAIAYMSFVSYGLLLAFTISFFRKHSSTKSLAILYFGFKIIGNPIVIYLLVKIDIPTTDIMTVVVGGVMQILFALGLIRYFMVSERVRKTFVNGRNDDDNHIMTALTISLGAIVLSSVLYAQQSSKETIIAGQIATAAQTTSADEPAVAEIAVDAAAPAAPAAVDDVVAPAFFPGQQETMIMASEKACNAGDMEECVTAGLDYSGDNHMDIKVDYSKAEKYYKKACDGGNAGGCARLGMMYDDAGKLPLDHSKAKKYYKKACDGGDNWGCHRLEQGFF